MVRKQAEEARKKAEEEAAARKKAEENEAARRKVAEEVTAQAARKKVEEVPFSCLIL